MSLIDLRLLTAALASAPRPTPDIDRRALPLAEREADRVAILAIFRSVASQLEQRAAGAGPIRPAWAPSSKG